MKKRLLIIIAMIMVIVMAASCTTNIPQEPAEESLEEIIETPGEEELEEAMEEPAEDEDTSGYEIAMITEIGGITEGSYSQSAWEGIVEYAEGNGITHKYYMPINTTTEAYVSAINIAIQSGAKVVVTPGSWSETAIYQVQDIYPDIHFFLLDGYPNDGDDRSGQPDNQIKNNVYSILYAEQQAAFLAGYAAVKEGCTKLGFMGSMPDPSITRTGYGFVQGAEYAAKQMELDAVEIRYHYAGTHEQTPETQTLAASWYGEGTDAIFAVGGEVFSSVIAAAEAANAKVIGVDMDQSGKSDTVVTSAIKELGNSLKIALEQYYDGTFMGGISETYDITNDAVGLPMKNSRFVTFSQAEYDAIYAALAADTDGIRSGILTDTDIESVDQLPMEIVSVTVVK